MQIYFFVLVYTFLSMATSALLKKTQQGIEMTFSRVIAINLINSVFGAVCFFIIGKFRISADIFVLVYAAIFSVFVTGNMVLQLVVYSKISVSFSALLATCGRIILSILYGIIVLREEFSLELVLAVTLLLFAAFLPARKMLSAKTGISTTILCTIWFLIAGAIAIFSKIYSTDTRLTDTNSMFFFTNVFSFCICSIVLLGCSIKYGKVHMQEMAKEVFRLRIIGYMAINTLPTNFITIVSVILLKYMPLSVHSVVTSSMGLLGGAALSAFMFKERLGRDNYIAIVLAIIAIILKH